MHIKYLCPYCKGAGSNGIPDPPPGELSSKDCTMCNTAGEFHVEIDASDMMDKIQDVLNKCNDILEAIQNP